MWPWNLIDDPEKQQGTSSILCQAMCIVSKSWVNSNWSYSLETLNSDKKAAIFCPVWPWNLMGDLEKRYGTSSILRWAMCIISKPSVNSNWSLGPETLNLGQNHFFLSRVTLKFNRWLWKTIGHLFYAISSFVHHFVAIGQFKLELRSRNAKLRFDLCDLDLWPLILTFYMDINSVIGNNSWKFHDDTMMGT